MPRIKNKIYKWISSIPHRNMEDKETEPISGSPAKSLPLTDWKKAFPMLSRYASNKLLIRQDIVLIGLCFQRMKMIKTYYRPLLCKICGITKLESPQRECESKKLV